MMLAEKFRRLGARVTLMLGPVEKCSLNKNINLSRFYFFEDLQFGLKRELRKHSYDAVIHSAAVSDYRPAKVLKFKIKSGIKKLRLELKPTPKIIELIKRISPSSLAVGFKFEPAAAKNRIIREAEILKKRAGLDLVVANTAPDNRYCAYIVGAPSIKGPFRNKQATSKALVDSVEDKWQE